MLFLGCKRCEGASPLNRLDGICGGIGRTVVEMRRLDGIYLSKEESMLEVVLRPRNR